MKMGDFKPGDVVSDRSANGMTWTGVVRSDVKGWCKPDEILVLRTGDTKPHVIPKRAVIPNSVRSRNAVVQKALNAVARNESIRHPYTAAGKRFLEKAKASIRKASDKDLGPGGMWLPNMLSEMERTPGLSDDEMDLIQDDLYRLIAVNADTSVLRETAVNGAGYVDASTVVIRPGDAVVFKTGYRSHSNDDDWLERNGDTVREVRGDEVKIGPSANDWAKIKDLMVWHNSRSTNSIVAKAMNASHKRRS